MHAKNFSSGLFFLFLVFPLFSFAATNELNPNRIQAIIPEFERYIKTGMEESHVPGLAIVIVDDQKIVYIKGFGVRRAGGELPVNSDTVFQIASVSKPLTSTVLAALVGEQKLHWDSPINELDPQFQLSDPWISKQLTLQDLLSHRSGLPDHAGDLLEDLGFDQQSILHKLRLLPLKGFRSNYAYTNSGFTEAALAAAKASNMSWETLAQEKLLKPLGMTATSTTFEGYIQKPNKADIHFISKNSAEPLYQRNPDAQSPAGGFSTNINDFAKWMLLQLADGKYQGNRSLPLMLLNKPASLYPSQMSMRRVSIFMGWAGESSITKRVKKFYLIQEALN